MARSSAKTLLFGRIGTPSASRGRRTEAPRVEAPPLVHDAFHYKRRPEPPRIVTENAPPPREPDAAPKRADAPEGAPHRPAAARRRLRAPSAANALRRANDATQPGSPPQAASVTRAEDAARKRVRSRSALRKAKKNARGARGRSSTRGTESEAIPDSCCRGVRSPDRPSSRGDRTCCRSSWSLRRCRCHKPRDTAGWPATAGR